MREGWECKKLGEVAKISSGKAIPSSDIFDTFSEGLYPCYGGNGLRGYVDHYSNDGLVPVIGRVGALCGNVHLPHEKFYATEHALVVNLKTNDKPHFIQYLLSSLNLRQYAKGVAQPVLSASTLSEIPIPVPPLSEQQRIVSELDLLSGIIEKKKAQLKEYDQLAQSIFYGMFGDPVTNEKGWEVKKLEDIGKIVTGNTPSKANPLYYNSSFIEWVKTDNIENNLLYATKAKEYLSEEGAKCGRIVDKGSLLVACIAGSLESIGKSCITDRRVAFNQQINAVVPDKSTCVIFLYHLIMSMKDTIKDYASTGMKHILTKSVMENIIIPTPPLSLQQSFAEKIEAIEHQKSLIQQSITETETLFNSRMDYYFN